MQTPSSIGDYALIGDGRSTALVGRDGSIDWLCWPRGDSPSLFGAILDPAAGRWQVAPVQAFRAQRRYLDHTNVLETRFETATGSAVLTDLMPVADEDEKHRLLMPEREILRLIRCERGAVELELLFEPRPGYGLAPARLTSAGALGIRMETAAGLLALRSDLPLAIEPGGVARARARLSAGEEAYASLTFAVEAPAVWPPLGAWSHACVDRTVDWWRRWASRIRYDGPRREGVVRSALALKLLVYAPSGAVLAAPTTSLPERIGGPLNWDYRFCWLRDASLTVRALFGIGCRDEAHAFIDWLLHTTRLTQPELRVLYDVHGNRPPTERTLPLAGYGESRPVRIGNAAKNQRQLDVYGEVIDAVTHFIKEGGTLDRVTEGLLSQLGEYVCREWDQPDEGIWEPRSGRADHTHSRVLCWAALDRLLQLHDQGHLRRAPIARFRDNRDAIRRQVESRAWSPKLGSYVSRLDGDDVDADLLLMAWYGFEPASSERMRGTYRCIRDRLGAGDALLYRYRTGESPGEGAFGVCGFWAAEYLAMGGGTAHEARELFERLCDYGNDVGLFGEEIDPATGAVLGNFPQAFTHVGVISAALSLARQMAGHAPVERSVPPRPAQAGSRADRL
jgi:GH15 family glucan-1,4-alpha-glucosidase